VALLATAPLWGLSLVPEGMTTAETALQPVPRDF